MVRNKEFTDQLISCDIVVWNGVIGEWSSFRSHITDGDMIRMADEEEVQQYKDKKNG